MIINFKFTSQDGQEIEGMRTKLDRNYDDEETALVFIHNDESDTGGYFELNIYKHKNGSLISDGYVCEYDSEDDSEPAYINKDIRLAVIEHDFDETLTKANEKLKPFGKRIVADYDGEGYWAVGSTDKDGSNPDYYAENDFEHEVQGDINECLAHVLAKVNDPNLARLGVGKLIDEQHVNYVANWRKALREDKDFIPLVIDHVQRAVNYILGRYETIEKEMGEAAALPMAA